MVSDLAEGFDGIYAFANVVVDDIIRSGDTELLENVVNKMFKLADEAAGFVCDYVKHNLGCKQLAFIRH